MAPLPMTRRNESTGKSSWQTKLLDIFERNLFFIFIIISLLLFCAGFLLYTYNRSFQVHQRTLSRILHWNNREGIFCSKAHVGHDGTTLEFLTIPKEVGTAGTIDPSSFLSGIPVDHSLTIPFFPYFFWIIGLSCLFLLILLCLFFIRKNKIKENKEEE